MAAERAKYTDLYWDNSGWTKIPGVRDINWNAPDPNRIEHTSQTGSTSQFEETTTGLRSPGTVTATINYEPSNGEHQKLMADWSAGNESDFQLRPSNTTGTAEATGMVHIGFLAEPSLSLSFETNNVKIMNLTLTLTGPPDFLEAAA